MAAYAFNEGAGNTLADLSGNGHAGAIVNAAWSTAGKYGNALSFNGADSLVNIPDASALHLTTGMTLEAWIKPTAAASGWQDVIYKGDDNYYLESSSLSPGVPVAGATAGASDTGAAGTSALPTNAWSFLTETYDGANLLLYVNGVQVAAQALSGSLATSTDLLQLGGDSIYGQYFQGLIDNVRIYNVALTAAEIQADMNTPIAASTTPTAPTDLTATASGSTITLNWTTSQDAIGVSSYVVERQDPGSASFVPVGTTTSTTYSDAGLAANSTYRYQVQSVDWAGDRSAVSSAATVITPAGNPALVAAYAFNEGTGSTLADLSGNGHAGVIVNAAWSTAGKYGNALSFNGANALVNIPDASSLRLTTGMTLEAWIKPTAAASGWQDVIFKGDDNYYLESSSLSPGVPVAGATAGSSDTGASGTSALPTNAWSFLTETYDGANLLLYVNGVQVASQPLSGSLATSTDQLQIGGDSLYGQYFQGLIDNVRIYNAALTAAEIQADMNTPIAAGGPPTAPTSLTATANGSTITLNWTTAQGSTGVSSYVVEREDPGGASFVQVGTSMGTTYSDTGLTANSTYRYQVQSVDWAGNQSAVSSAASVTTPAVNPALVAAYAFNEGAGTTLNDLAGNGHAGAIVNATWSTAGKFGGALSFNGADALVNIPDASSLHLTTGMTLEAWVEPTAAANEWRDVIYKGDDNYYLEASALSTGAPTAGATAGSSDASASDTRVLPTNAWSFLTETYDGTNLLLYVNGVQAAAVPLSGSLASSTNLLQIGGDSIYGQYFQGLIDNIRIYNVALTAAEIQADMNTPIAASALPPTAPTNLTATANGGTITLNWTTSQDSTGVISYVVQREAPGSTSFVPIGTTTRPTYSDAGLSPGSLYRYQVQAIDWAGYQSAVSSAASATAQFAVSPNITTFLQPGQTQQFTANAPGMVWSVNGVTGGSASTGTISSTGLYAAPSSVGSYTVTGATADGAYSASVTVNVTNYSGTLTERNDSLRTGANLDETTLTPSNVNSSTFGKLFSYPLDGIAFASPLYVPHVDIPGKGYHNVVIVATEHDTVYAFDADGSSAAPLWQVSFIDPAAGITPIPAGDTLELVDIPNEVGITGTPVIDPATGTLYLVADTKVVANGATTYYQTLHALDITTGAEKFGEPVVIQATVPGTGSDSVNGMVTFNPLYQNQHSGLLLSNGVVYIAFSSHGDDFPDWHGWVFGYDATTLQQVMVYNDSPNGNGGGIWMGADGLASDSTGDIYFTTGNADFDANTGGADYGDSAERISPSGTVVDYFTPYDQAALNDADLDLGSGGLLLLPTQSGPYPHEMIFSGKGGTIYVVNRDNMGHYNATDNSQIIQSLPNVSPAGAALRNFSSPVYYDGNVYIAPLNGAVQAFSLTDGLLSTTPTSQSAESYGYPGGMMAISANGATNGILWVVERTGQTTAGVLHAYLATNLSEELYNSSQAGSRDTMDLPAKFSMPTVANGKVYIGGCTQLTVYGLLASNPPSAGGASAASQSQAGNALQNAGPVAVTTAAVADASSPVARPDTFVLSQNGANRGSGEMSVLANDTSTDGQRQNLVAKIVSSVTHGALTFNPDGSFTYTPNSTFQGI
ncbi:MAG TPA: LamG-like jellyroll fold domain-containing protein, partial [Pirellulales bacterium]|nr:LamG-like jellyroll fold domain-containing protein [Pirellulales bacterium]